MRSKGSRFTLGIWGLRVCPLDVAPPFATLRNRSQPFTTVCVRSLWPCLWGSAAKAVAFGGSNVAQPRFRVADVALCDIATCFITCQKSFRVIGAILFCVDFRRWLSCFAAGPALWTCQSSFCVAGTVLLTGGAAFFCESHCQGCVKWWQRALHGRHGILWRVMKIEKSLARNIDFEVANFEGSLRKLVGKRRFWSYQVWKF